jgi:predicted Zn-dependent protease with MMP-like domain
MDRDEFELLVVSAVENLPEDIRAMMENVDIVVEDWPARQQLSRSGLKGSSTLLGLYEGVPLTARGTHYGLVAPDKITIFQKPVEAMARQREAVIRQIQEVVRHEIAHHFGIGDVRLRQIEKDRRKAGRE